MEGVKTDYNDIEGNIHGKTNRRFKKKNEADIQQEAQSKGQVQPYRLLSEI